MKLIDVQSINWRIDEDGCPSYTTVNDIRMMKPVDPVHAVGGYYCRECKYHLFDADYGQHWCNVPMGCLGSVPVKLDDFCSYSKLKEVHDDESN